MLQSQDHGKEAWCSKIFPLDQGGGEWWGGTSKIECEYLLPSKVEGKKLLIKIFLDEIELLYGVPLSL